MNHFAANQSESLGRATEHDRVLPVLTDIIDIAEIKELSQQAEERVQAGKVTAAELDKAYSLLDLTTLKPTDTVQSVTELVQRVIELGERVPELSPLAGVCAAGEGAVAAASLLRGSDTRVATVVNFALGQSPLTAVLHETKRWLERGVGEIDLVFPLARFLDRAAETELVNFVSEVKSLCEQYGKPLKTIIQSDEVEVGAEPFDEAVLKQIERLASISYAGGSDMVKTSTGQGGGAGASFQSVAVIAQVAKYYRDHTNYQERFGHAPGIKVSGGVKRAENAAAFMDLVSEVLGPESLTPELFRFGAKSLGAEILEELSCLGSGALPKALSREEINGDYFELSGDGIY